MGVLWFQSFYFHYLVHRRDIDLAFYCLEPLSRCLISSD